ncbi:transcriptional regulator [Streptomyces canus]|uniref:transcriptional regulator n=1 Tax=Streptomyces canus TaxID=58343 RepID=UPI002254B119|nr:transcriptional regulator [Streptomyces canus]MCX4858641.1 helix-turn-helix domain-containing protein [Streptomyces canus]
MSEETGTERTEEFAQVLRELKDRSGLSYGTLAKRLHMSTSTLHRYCNGTAVPVEYAPVERLARVCRATPQELVELHRRWILADAARGRKADQGTARGPAQEAGPDRTAEPGQGAAGGENGEPVVTDTAAAAEPPRRPSWLRRRGTALIAAVAVVAALSAVAYALRPTAVRAGDTTTSTVTGTLDVGGPAKPSATPSPSGSDHKPSASASASPTGTAASGDTGSGASTGDGKQGANRPATGVPLAVAVRPYVYEDPCSQHFLVDSDPEQVGPPATEENAPRWSAAYGAVASGEQRVALTVQGTGEDTVVLNSLHVRVLAKGAPLAWNDYSMGVGCGGGVGTKSFDVDLDDGSPTVTVKNGQRDFPYKVSESDPEVFYVSAHTKAHDVRWDLSLDWSSGDRSGTVHLDNAGRPFRTSADAGRPGYDYPLGSSEWIERVGG